MPARKLDVAKVREVLCATGTAAEIAEEYGVSHQTIRLYKNLKTDLAREAASMLHAEGLAYVPLANSRRHKFTPELVEEIRGSDDSSSTWAKKLGCSASLIRMIRTGKTYNG